MRSISLQQNSLVLYTKTLQNIVVIRKNTFIYTQHTDIQIFKTQSYYSISLSIRYLFLSLELRAISSPKKPLKNS